MRENEHPYFCFLTRHIKGCLEIGSDTYIPRWQGSIPECMDARRDAINIGISCGTAHFDRVGKLPDRIIIEMQGNDVTAYCH